MSNFWWPVKRGCCSLCFFFVFFSMNFSCWFFCSEPYRFLFFISTFSFFIFFFLFPFSLSCVVTLNQKSYGTWSYRVVTGLLLGFIFCWKSKKKTNNEVHQEKVLETAVLQRILYWVWLGLTGFDWVWLGLTGFYWVARRFFIEKKREKRDGNGNDERKWSPIPESIKKRQKNKRWRDLIIEINCLVIVRHQVEVCHQCPPFNQPFQWPAPFFPTKQKDNHHHHRRPHNPTKGKPSPSRGGTRHCSEWSIHYIFFSLFMEMRSFQKRQTKIITNGFHLGELWSSSNEKKRFICAIFFFFFLYFFFCFEIRVLFSSLGSPVDQ